MSDYDEEVKKWIEEIRKSGWHMGGSSPKFSDRVIAEIAFASYQAQKNAAIQTKKLNNYTIVLLILTGVLIVLTIISLIY